ncbi:Cu/Ag efflux protein CusF [Aquabacterium commune]|jgi:Cu(I)/Ag(I) efflux system periplasmic protein CusF|uniref:Cu/Ag efflux protein CusF n=3 Tax=Burkholderiales TaxID=80840 RepID=A0A4R6QY26_9BURK|nr:copper-binding protein [Aquabacterium commune]TDP78162.1 Cu/Ag efflux protein CusF [Aquabacterium commune]
MKISNSFAVLGSLALAAAFATNVYAQTTMNKDSMPGMDMSGMKMAPTDKGGMAGMNMPGMAMGTSATATATEGEVRKIDKENQKITLKHGDIKNLDMPGMTMVFKVKDAAMLDKVQVGSKVRFKAEKSDGAIVVTSVELAQ